VKLTILNLKTSTTKDVTLTRASITVQNVTWHLLPGSTAAHLRIATFSKGVAENLQKALLSVEKEGVAGLILDMRNNPGGLYDEAVSSASQFLSGGNVLIEKNALGKIKPVPVRSGGVATSLPLVVLINGGTSSGAEIVAGALQDAHRAKLVGEKTFGTGTVLETFSLSDGSALMLAIEEWLTPAEKVIWHHGIVPDVAVPLPPEVTPLIPTNEKGLTPEELRNSKDAQLLRALDLLLREKRHNTKQDQRERLPYDFALAEVD
jgi:carboxyl-terminal processing protease